MQWTFSKVAVVRNAHGHVVKMQFGTDIKDTWLCWLKLWITGSTYQERLLLGVMKRKCLRLVIKEFLFI